MAIRNIPKNQATKFCSRCKKTKPTKEFSSSGNTLRKWCKDCLLKRSVYQKNNRERINANAKRYLDKHPEAREKLRKRGRTYYHSHVEEQHTRASQWRQKNTSVCLLGDIRKRVIKFCLPFDVDAKYLDSIRPQGDICPLLGIKMVQNKGVLKDNSITIDRLIPELGYIKGNVLWCCYKANRMKNNATLDELKLLTKNLGRILSKKKDHNK
jgi:hypothetical protein